MPKNISTACALTRELIRIDSSDPGAFEGEIGDYITDWLARLQIPSEKREVLPGRYNIRAKIQGEGEEPCLTFICHMDTVVLGDGWIHDPLGGELWEERIYGRGACDMKSGLACAMSAFAAAARTEKPARRSLQFIATVDEEDYMRGVEQAVKDGWVTKDSWVLDTEPTNGEIQVSHKGRIWFEVSIQGITAHAATPWKGADAVAAMAETVSEIRRQIHACPLHPDMGCSTVAFGQIQGGYRPYVVPDFCRVWIDMRLVPPTGPKAAGEIVDGAVQRACRLVPGTKGAWRVTGNRPCVEMDGAAPLLSALRQSCLRVTGKEARVNPFPGYTDSAVIAGILGNTNCMSYGPGDLELAHKPEESVPTEDILRCEQVLTDLALRFLFQEQI